VGRRWASLDVRDLTKQYGPPQSHFDLMGSRIDDFIRPFGVDTGASGVQYSRSSCG
jgi:hypothetical protein